MRGRLAELVELADDLCARAGTSRQAVTQTVIGTPGVYDPQRNAIALTGGLAGWDRPAALAGLREAFGPTMALENDVDAAALAERTHGYGRDRESFAFVHIGTGIGMGLVLGGGLHRGVHGVAGEIAFMPLAEGESARRGAGGRWRPRRPRPASSAPRARPGCAARCRPAACSPPPPGAMSGRWRWWPRKPGWSPSAICCVITVVDPGLIVLGGGIGQAPGFAAAVTAALSAMTPVQPEVKVSALGTDVVVDGCLAEGASLAWNQLTSAPLGHAARSAGVTARASR